MPCRPLNSRGFKPLIAFFADPVSLRAKREAIRCLSFVGVDQ